MISLFFLLLACAVQAMSVEEIGRLSELKTGDELMLQVIEKGGLDKPITTADVIYLREHGTSERVIQYLLTLSEKPKPAEQPVVQAESKKISDNLRAYTTTTKSGRTIRVVTNMDEQGNRMGDPVPPPPPEQYAAPEPPPAQQVYVTVSDERMNDRRHDYEEEENYQEEPQPSGGIPLYDSGYYPYYPGYPGMSYPYAFNGAGMHRSDFQHGHAHWRSVVPPLRIRPSAISRPMQRLTPPASSFGMRRFH